MRILFLSPRQVWPPTSGAKLREYHLARELSREAQLTMMAFSAEPMAGMDFCKEVLCQKPPERYTPWKILRGLAGSVPLPVLNYTTLEMQAAVRSLLQRERFDILHVEGAVMSAYAAERQPELKVVHDWHNIESELMYRYATSNASPLRRWYAQQTAARLERLEQTLLQQDTHLVCSEREARELERRSPGARVHVVPNGVDASYFSDQAQAEALAAAHWNRTGGRHRLLFVGAMDYHANVEGALKFAKLWPELFRLWPHLRWTIAGSNPTPAVKSLAEMPGVEVTGTVPDLRPYYAEAAVAVVPLYTGGGTRLKILEALAAGIPVVSTSVGAEGLAIQPGEHLLLADTSTEWMAALQRILDHAGERQRLSESGRGLVLRTYDWPVIGASLRSIYQDLVQQRHRGGKAG